MAVNFQAPLGNLISTARSSGPFNCRSGFEKPFRKSNCRRNTLLEFFQRRLPCPHVSECLDGGQPRGSTLSPYRRRSAPGVPGDACRDTVAPATSTRGIELLRAAACAAALSSMVPTSSSILGSAQGWINRKRKAPFDVSCHCQRGSDAPHCSEFAAAVLATIEVQFDPGVMFATFLRSLRAQQRNPILEVLRDCPCRTRRQVLEIGSGTGQHAVYFSRTTSHTLSGIPPNGSIYLQRSSDAAGANSKADRNLRPPTPVGCAADDLAVGQRRRHIHRQHACISCHGRTVAGSVYGHRRWILASSSANTAVHLWALSLRRTLLHVTEQRGVRQYAASERDRRFRTARHRSHHKPLHEPIGLALSGRSRLARIQ